MTTEMLVAIITALGLKEILQALAKAGVARLNGRAAERRNQVRSAADALEAELRARRGLEEYASVLRRTLIELGVDPSEIPPEPPRR